MCGDVIKGDKALESPGGLYHLAHDCNNSYNFVWDVSPVSNSHNHDPVAKDCIYTLAKNKHRHVFLT